MTGSQLQLPFTTDAAEEFTEALGLVLAGGIRLTEWGKENGMPSALDLSTEEWVNRKLSGLVHLSIPEKKRAVKKLTDPVEEGGLGRGTAEAAALVGLTQRQVQRLVRRATNVVPPGEPPDREGDSETTNVAPPPEAWLVEPCADCGKPTRRRWLHDEDEFGGRLLCDDCAGALDQATPVHVHVGENTGESEWYTPAEYIEAACAVMGDIDLDPASTAAANVKVGATVYYDTERDGLRYAWYGRVWLNPPYAQPLCSRFCGKLVEEFAADRVTEACVLVNNATETEWFQGLARASAAMCFPEGRVRFWHPERESSAPLQGQAVLYLGPNVTEFLARFGRFGFVLGPADA